MQTINERLNVLEGSLSTDKEILYSSVLEYAETGEHILEPDELRDLTLYIHSVENQISYLRSNFSECFDILNELEENILCCDD
jgi:hypothetical protein